MITGRLAFVLLAAAVAGGCGGLGSFDIDLSGKTEIPGLAQQFTDPYASGAAVTQIQQTLDNKGVKANEIQSAEITAGYVSVPANDAEYMKNISSFMVTVSAPGLPTATIAQQSATAFSLQPAPAKVAFQIPSVSMKPYITASSMTFSATYTPNSSALPPPAAGVPLTVDLTLHVQAQIP